MHLGSHSLALPAVGFLDLSLLRQQAPVRGSPWSAKLGCCCLFLLSLQWGGGGGGLLRVLPCTTLYLRLEYKNNKWHLGGRKSSCLALCLLFLFGIMMALKEARRAGKRLTEGKRAPPPARAPRATCGNKASECGLSRATGSSVLGHLPVQPPHSLLLGVLSVTPSSS